MRNPSFGFRSKKVLSEINVVPYIDVMLVLLVIFMITAPLLSQGVYVQLPQVESKILPPEEDMPIIVSVNQKGEYFLNQSPQPDQAVNEQYLLYRVAGLLALATQEHKIQHVYVKGDRATQYGTVVQVMSLLQKAGVESVGLMTDSPSHPN